MKRKTLIVVDTYDSAIAQSAFSRFKSESFEVVEALNFQSPGHLLDFLCARNAYRVHFAWREVLHNLLVTQKTIALDALFSTSVVGFGVADYLGLIEERRVSEFQLICASDYFTVVNEDLAQKYFKTFDISKVPPVLHDMPDLERIEANFKDGREKSLDFIWVGNSKWGSNYGMNDYKGYQKFISPLMSLTENVQHNMNSKIIDSAITKLNHNDVLASISSSKTLILSSVQEGTGLPVLEALGLGTLPISTNVGVIPELIKLNPRIPIFETFEELQAILKRNVLDPTFNSDECRSIYSRFVQAIIEEELPQDFYDFDVKVLPGFSFKAMMRVQILWKLRRIKRYMRA